MGVKMKSKVTAAVLVAVLILSVFGGVPSYASTNADVSEEISQENSRTEATLSGENTSVDSSQNDNSIVESDGYDGADNVKTSEEEPSEKKELSNKDDEIPGDSEPNTDTKFSEATESKADDETSEAPESKADDEASKESKSDADEQSKRAQSVDAPDLEQPENMPLLAEGNSTPVEGSSNLNEFVSKVIIDSNDYDEEGNVVIYSGSDYDFSISFAEEASPDGGSGGKQFGPNPLKYRFPLGFVLAPGTGNFEISCGTDENGNEVKLTGNTYSINGNIIEVYINENGGASYDAYLASAMAQFSLGVSATVTLEREKHTIVFGTDVSRTVNVQTDSGLDIEKEGSYDDKNGKFIYSLVVRSKGRNTDVKLTDTLGAGAVMSYDAGSFKLDGLTITPVMGDGNKSFSYSLGTMNDGDIHTITYETTIDYSKISADAKEFTVEQTGNSVSVKSNEAEDLDNHDFSGKTIYEFEPKKRGVYNKNTGIIDWTITLNENSVIYVGGASFTDTLDNSTVAKLHYTGDGIIIEEYVEGSQNPVVTTERSWSTIGIDTSSAESFNTTLPENDAKEARKYVIKYSTKVDDAKVLASVNVKNKVEFKGKIKEFEVPIVVVDRFSVDKTGSVVGDSEGTINWKIEIKVPAEGAEQFEIVDTLPIYWSSQYSENFRDVIYEGIEGITVEGVESGYVIDIGQEQPWKCWNLTISFPNGIAGTGSERIITVSYKTRPENGVTVAMWGRGKHENKVTVTIDGNKKDDTYIVWYEGAYLRKDIVSNQALSPDGLPMYEYQIKLYGNLSGKFSVTDDYDEKYMTLSKRRDGSLNVLIGYSDTDEFKPDLNSIKTIKPEDIIFKDDGTILFDIDPAKYNLLKDGNTYHTWYFIQYWMQVKDSDALEELFQAAAKSKDGYIIKNSAQINNGGSDSASISFGSELLTKEVIEASDSNNYFATYTLEINPNALWIGADDCETITVEDKASNNLVLQPSSVVVTYDSDGDGTAEKHSDAIVSYSPLTITIPNAVAATVTYRAKVKGTGEQEYSNTATITAVDYSKTVTNVAIIESSGSGRAISFRIKLMKLAEVDKTPVAGATYVLSESENGGQSFVPVRKKGGNQVKFTTGEDGTVTVYGNQNGDGWSLLPYSLYGIIYKLEEESAPEGFGFSDPVTFKVDEHKTDDLVYTNGEEIIIYEPQVVTISGIKTWVDNNNEDNIRPISITVNLLADGVEVQEKIVTARDDWKYSFTDLPKYSESGSLITYTVTEDVVTGYTASIEGYDITNTHTSDNPPPPPPPPDNPPPGNPPPSDGTPPTPESFTTESPDVLGAVRIDLNTGQVVEAPEVLGQSRTFDTGDESDIERHVAIIVAAMGAIAVILLTGKKRNTNTIR